MIICPSSHKPSLSHHIHSSASSAAAGLRIDVHPVDQSSASPLGTCALLRLVANRIPTDSDLILLPCDFLPPPSLPLNALLNTFRIDTSTDGAIGTACLFSNGKEKEKEKDKGNDLPEEWGVASSSSSEMTVAWDEKTHTLLHVDTLDALDRNNEELELKMSLLSRLVVIPLLLYLALFFLSFYRTFLHPLADSIFPKLPTRQPLALPARLPRLRPSPRSSRPPPPQALPALRLLPRRIPPFSLLHPAPPQAAPRLRPYTHRQRKHSGRGHYRNEGGAEHSPRPLHPAQPRLLTKEQRPLRQPPRLPPSPPVQPCAGRVRPPRKHSPRFHAIKPLGIAASARLCAS